MDASSNYVYAGQGFTGSPKLYQLKNSDGSKVAEKSVSVNDIEIYEGGSNTHIYVASQNGTLKKYKNGLSGGDEWTHPVPASGSNANKVSVANNTGEVAYATDGANNAYKIKPSNGDLLQTYTDTSDSTGSYDVSALELGNDGNTLYLAENGSGYQIHKRDISGGGTGSEITSGNWPFTNPSNNVRRVTIGSAGSYGFAGTSGESLLKFSLSDASNPWTFTGHSDAIFDIGVYGTDAVYTGSADNSVKKVDFSSGNEVDTYSSFSGAVGTAATGAP